MPDRPYNPGRLIKRQKLATRVTHWTWAVCLFFLLLSGLQIFNAHPALYLGDQSGFTYENAILEIEGFPSWLIIPSTQDLATGRVVHFFFAWILVMTLALWLVASLFNRHLRKDLLPTARDAKNLVPDIRDHLKLRFIHAVRYSPLQKLAYGGVLFVLFPLIILTGLAMSPGMNAVMPWLPELFGGRQSARTVHFAVMVLLVLFFVVHMAMILLAGPFNELRSIVTGRYRLSPRRKSEASHG
ncbi:cytochrome b/b6 domain-containing protein [Taklimakanibacter deserti]|uniref:cytochrome b/b6 domain-containing protein n=1 Tax=Taklimakanibacter deserti TaxID=2267839 RepID=UPI000E651823